MSCQETMQESRSVQHEVTGPIFERACSITPNLFFLGGDNLLELKLNIRAPALSFAFGLCCEEISGCPGYETLIQNAFPKQTLPNLFPLDGGWLYFTNCVSHIRGLYRFDFVLLFVWELRCINSTFAPLVGFFQWRGYRWLCDLWNLSYLEMTCSRVVFVFFV